MVEGFSFANCEARPSLQLISFQRIHCANVTESFNSHEHQPHSALEECKKAYRPLISADTGRGENPGVCRKGDLAAYRYRHVRPFTCLHQPEVRHKWSWGVVEIYSDLLPKVDL